MKWFQPPVPVKGKKLGARYNVTSVEAALEHMQTWESRGPKWRKCYSTCYEALEDRVEPEAVRKAFEAAAKEAGMLLPPIAD